MNVLVIGSGAREHAIAWKLRQSPRVDRLLIAPGNAGTAAAGTNLQGSPEDLDEMVRLAEAHEVDLTVVGSETPLSSGIVDTFSERGLAVFGPTKAAARIESSKGFAKELMERHGVPCPQFKIFHDYQTAEGFLSAHDGPIVVKADGLAAGKGVFVCQEKEQALAALRACMMDGAFGSSGDTVVLEEYLEGREVSVFTFCDGDGLSSLVAACDYKRLHDGDAGPNTGGMGSYTPPEFWTASLERTVREEIMVPVVRALRDEGAPYRGVLYAGLMVTSQGLKVIEFNCRLGDPEAQVILPLLGTDLVEVIEATLDGTADTALIHWRREACVGVVLASGGYPGEYARGLPITGLDQMDSGVEVFHAGTNLGGEGNIVTDGGRVVTVTATGETLSQARERAYDNVRRISFQGAHYRSDVALVAQGAAT